MSAKAKECIDCQEPLSDEEAGFYGDRCEACQHKIRLQKHAEQQQESAQNG